MKLKSPQEHQGTNFLSTMPNWYYDKRELKETPSVQDGIDYETEQRYRKEGARFIINVGSRMGLRYDTMATGVVYFHRFYMFHSFRTFPRFVTASCCLFLAGKVEETPKKCKDIIKTAQSLLTEQQFAQFGEDPKEEVMTLERILLQTIKFDLQVDHPYGYLLKYAKSLKGDKAKLQKLVQMAWTFINDSLCTTLCLQWEPEIIGIALMYLAGKLSKFEVTDWNGRTSKHTHWWDMFVENMSTELLEDICHQVLDLYSSPLPTTPQDSPPATPPPPKQNRKSFGASQKNSPTSPASSTTTTTTTTTTPPCQPKLKEQISAKSTPNVKAEVTPPAASPKNPDPPTPGTPIAPATPKASATPNASATTLPAQVPSMTSITLAVPPVATEPAPVMPVVPPDPVTMPVYATGIYDWNPPAQPLPPQAVPLENANVYRTGDYSQNREQLVGEPDSKFRKDQIHFTGFDPAVPPVCIKSHTALPPSQATYMTQVGSAYPPGFAEKHGKELPYYPPKTPPQDGQYPPFQLPPQYYRTSEAQDQYYSHIHHSSNQQPPFRPSPNAMIQSHRNRPASPLPPHILSKGPLPPPPPSIPAPLFQEQYVNRSMHGRSQFNAVPPPTAIYPPHHGPLPPSLPNHRSGMNPNMPSMGLYRYTEHPPEASVQHHPFEENSGSMPHGRILGRF